jgi:hypothetical protein
MASTEGEASSEMMISRSVSSFATIDSRQPASDSGRLYEGISMENKGGLMILIR